MKKSQVQVDAEYIHTKSNLKVKILRPFAEDYFEVKKPNGDKMIVSPEFLEKVQVVPVGEVLPTGKIKRGRGRPKKMLTRT